MSKYMLVVININVGKRQTDGPRIKSDYRHPGGGGGGGGLSLNSVRLAYELSGIRLDYRKIARTASCWQFGAHLSKPPDF